jgi:hypothetical protein
VRADWSSFEGFVEVKLKPFVLGDCVVRDLENVDFMVAFEMDNSQLIFIEEVVCYHKATIILVQNNVERSRIRAEADKAPAFRRGPFRSLFRCKESPGTRPGPDSIRANYANRFRVTPMTPSRPVPSSAMLEGSGTAVAVTSSSIFWLLEVEQVPHVP